MIFIAIMETHIYRNLSLAFLLPIIDLNLLKTQTKI